MTARTATFTPFDLSRVLTWSLAGWIVRQALAILTRVGLAFTLIVAGGVLAPLLAGEIAPADRPAVTASPGTSVMESHGKVAR